ncbi:MAG: hypothetical protein V7L27_06315 [Nostoc sp.]
MRSPQLDIWISECAFTSNNLSQLPSFSIKLKLSILVLVSYLHDATPVHRDLSNILEATNCKEVIKILKYLHFLLTSVTVKADAYHQTLT